jgi:hypothetical protein
LPPHFIRHTKKIGDEPDITVDYCIEDEDLVNAIFLINQATEQMKKNLVIYKVL